MFIYLDLKLDMLSTFYYLDIQYHAKQVTCITFFFLF